MSIKALNSVAGFSVGETPTEVILANGDITTGNALLSGNVVTGSIFTDDYRYANGAPVDFAQPAGTTYQLQYNLNGDFGATDALTFNPISNTLNVANAILAGNITSIGNVSAQFFLGNFIGNISGNLTVPGINTSVIFNNTGTADATDSFTFNKNLNVLEVKGNIQTQNISASQSIATETIIGTIQTPNQPNIIQLGNLGNLTVNTFINTDSITGNTANFANINGNNITSNSITGNTINSTNLTVSQNISGLNQELTGNLSVLGNVVANNYSGNNLNISNNIAANTGSFSANLSAGETSITGNLSATGNVTADIITANQVVLSSNLSVGASLSASELSVSGNLQVGNLSIASTISSNLIPNISNTYVIGNQENRWSNLWLSNDGVYLGDLPIKNDSDTLVTNNIRSNGNVTTTNLNVSGVTNTTGDVNITGNLTVNGNTKYVNVDTVAIKDPIIPIGGSTNGANAEVYDGKDRGLLLQNYLPDGTAPENQFFGWKTQDQEFIAVSNVGSSTNEIIVPNRLGNIRANVFKGNIEGRVLTSNQPNITSLGNLTGLNVSGNLNVTGTANVTALRISNTLYPTTPGSSGQVLTTNGAGSIYYSTPITDELFNGTSNVKVHENSNVTVSVNGNANVLTVTSNTAEVNGTLLANTVSGSEFVLGITKVGHASITTSSTALNQVIASIPISDIRGAEFFIKGEENSGAKYSVESISAVHNGTSVEFSKYGAVNLGGATGALSVRIAAGFLQLIVTPSSSNATSWTTQYRTI